MFRRDRDDVPILVNNWGRSDGVEMRRNTGGNNFTDVLVTIPHGVGSDIRYSENRIGDLGGARRLEDISAAISNGIGAKKWDSHGVSHNDYLYKSGRMGVCNDPHCGFCPADFRAKFATNDFGLYSSRKRFSNVFHGDANNWTRKFIKSYFPIVSPHEKKLRYWNRFFVTSCLVAIFIDPLFFFSLAVEKDNSCVVFDLSYAAVIIALRSVTDVIYLLHMFLQFRIAYVAPESRISGSGDLVTDPRKIASHYLRGYFLLDLLAVLPLPQVIILAVIPKHLGSSADSTKNLIRLTILFQYIPRIIRFLPLVDGQTGSRFIFESAWANFVINLLMFALAGHVVGSCWYLFGFQRVNRCLKDVCHFQNLSRCRELVDCGKGTSQSQFSPDLDPIQLDDWKKNVSLVCFGNGLGEYKFDYGIYAKAPIITTKNIIVRYVYSLFWGFQQISTLAGNLVPSDYVMEVLFTMAIVGLGLLLFAMLIGNMQNFLQSLGRRRSEMQLRRRDVEQWMSHRRLPEYLRTQVREAERFNWAATRGVNGEVLLQNLPENLQREIRRHLFSFLKKVRIFTLIDEPILDVIYERLKQKLYLNESNIFHTGGPVEKMIFIVRGEAENIGADGITSILSEGDVCGEELLAWCLEHSSVNRDEGKVELPAESLISNRTVKCKTNVEAFALWVDDLRAVTKFFSRFLRHPRVQGAIRYESPYWRSWAAGQIQVTWKYRKRCLKRGKPEQQRTILDKSLF